MSSADPRVAVAAGVHRTAVQRLAQGLVPVGVVALVGLVELARPGRGDVSGLVLVGGAVAAAAAMVMTAMRAVRRVLGPDRRVWTTVAAGAGFLPHVLGLYLLVLRGLQSVAGGGGASQAAAGLMFVGLGGWLMQRAARLSEVHSLAATMATALQDPRMAEGGKGGADGF